MILRLDKCGKGGSIGGQNGGLSRVEQEVSNHSKCVIQLSTVDLGLTGFKDSERE